MLLTRKMLMVLGLCWNGLNWAEEQNLLPIRVEELTVDFILQNRINLFSIAIGLHSGLYEGYRRLNVSQDDLATICRALKRQYLINKDNTWFYKDRFEETFPESETEFMRPFVESYLLELVKFLTENWDDIVEATENYVEEDYDEIE